MAKDFALAFYHSKKWLDCRAAFIKERRAIDGGLCQRCHDLPGYIVHHKIYLTSENITDFSVSLNHDNLEYVCKQCHDMEHFTPTEKPLLCGFDEKGRPIDGNAKGNNN